MHIQKIEKPVQFFEDLGGIHDANIQKITWDKLKQELSLTLDDLNSCFVGLPEYDGLASAEIIFGEVVLLEVNLEISDDVNRIYDLTIVSMDKAYEATIKCSPAGFLKCTCRTISKKILK